MNFSSVFSLLDTEMNKSRCNSEYKKVISVAFVETSVMIIITMLFTSLFSYLFYLISGWVESCSSDKSSSVGTVMLYVSIGVFCVNALVSFFLSFTLGEEYSTLSEFKRMTYKWIILASNSLTLSFISLFFQCFYSMILLLAGMLLFLQLCRIYYTKVESSLSCLGRWIFMLLLAAFISWLLCLFMPSMQPVFIMVLMGLLVYSIDKQMRQVRKIMLENEGKSFNIPWIGVTMATYIYLIVFMIVIQFMGDMKFE